MKPSTQMLLVLLGAAAWAPSQSRGHEFWIEPTNFSPKPNSAVVVQAWLGERFAGKRVARDERHIDTFTMIGPNGETPVVGREGAAQSFARAATPGTHVIGYRSEAAMHRMNATQFDGYLRHEGLGRIADLRAERGESDKPGREVYSRWAKSIVTVSAPTSGATSTADKSQVRATDDRHETGEGHDRLLNFPLELVPGAHPHDLRPGDQIAMRLMHDGSPLAGATIVAVHRSEPDRLHKAQTDVNGVAKFAITQSGAWLFTSVHMVPAATNTDADWESFWASLTLEVPDRRIKYNPWP